jgi:hypothetical protein
MRQPDGASRLNPQPPRWPANRAHASHWRAIDFGILLFALWLASVDIRAALIEQIQRSFEYRHFKVTGSFVS